MRRFVVLAVLAASWGGVAHAAPLELNHQGRISDANGPLTGSKDVTFELFTSSTATTPVWAETKTLTFSDGYFATKLGTDELLDDGLFASDFLYLGIVIDGAELLPRQRVGAVPLAARAYVASEFAGGSLDATELRIDGHVVVGSDGSVDATTLSVGGHPIIDASGKLVGGGTTLQSLTCAAGQLPIYTGTAWSCGTFPDNAVLTPTEVRAAVEAAPVYLAAGSRVGGEPIATGEPDWDTLKHVPADLRDGDDDALGGVTCNNNELAVWSSVFNSWGCLPAAAAGKTDGQIVAVVEAAPLSLASGTRIGGYTVLQLVQSAPIALAAGSTLNGAPIQVGAHSWTTLQDIPPGLLDGDSDALGALRCATGDVPVFSTAFNAWGCLPFSTEVRATVQAATLDLDPDTTFGGMSVVELVEALPVDLAAGSTVGGRAIMATGDDGGDTYTAWGKAGCPSGDTLLYTGYMFGAHYTHGGARDPICVQGGSGLGPVVSYDGDLLYMLELGNAEGSTNATSKALPCAVCLAPHAPCFEMHGARTCPTGFSPHHAGNMYGGHYTHSSGDRMCIAGQLDAPLSGAGGTEGWLYPTVIHSTESPFTSLYPDSSVIGCAECCRN